MNDLEQRQRRLDRARFLIRAELVIAFAAPVFAGFLLTAPGTMGGGMFYVGPSLVPLVPWAGAIGVIVGTVWMLRLSRPDPEAGQRTWRYRAF